MKRTYSQIGLDERRKIARWRTTGLSIEVIAEKLGRHRSTIFREVRRNMFIDGSWRYFRYSTGCHPPWNAATVSALPVIEFQLMARIRRSVASHKD